MSSKSDDTFGSGALSRTSLTQGRRNGSKFCSAISARVRSSEAGASTCTKSRSTPRAVANTSSLLNRGPGCPSRPFLGVVTFALCARSTRHRQAGGRTTPRRWRGPHRRDARRCGERSSNRAAGCCAKAWKVDEAAVSAALDADRGKLCSGAEDGPPYCILKAWAAETPPAHSSRLFAGRPADVLAMASTMEECGRAYSERVYAGRQCQSGESW